VVSDPGLDVQLTTLSGEQRPLSEWLTTFHLAAVLVDPYTNESAWVLPVATRILESLRGSSARVAFVVTAGRDEAKQFLGPIADEFLVFCDSERGLVRKLALEELPAFVFLRIDGTVQATAQGWTPSQWRSVAEAVAGATSWLPPNLPGPRDPGPFKGTPALG
jgi:hypothetical protein